MIRVPVWPGVKLTFGGAPNPSTVKVSFGWPYTAEPRTIRLVSKCGWMLLLVRYDWRPGDKNR